MSDQGQILSFVIGAAGLWGVASLVEQRMKDGEAAVEKNHRTLNVAPAIDPYEGADRVHVDLEHRPVNDYYSKLARILAWGAADADGVYHPRLGEPFWRR